MADKYETPGVYIKEISTISPSVAQVETAIPAFIGYTEKAEKNGVSLINKPTRITSLTEYEQYFGTVDESDIAISVEVEIINDGTKNTISKITPTLTSTTIFKMYYSLRFYFDNGGGPCYIISVGKTSSFVSSNAATNMENALPKLKLEDDPTIIVFPDANLITSTDTAYYGVYDKSLAQCAELGDRFTIIDVKKKSSSSDTPIDNMRGELSKNLKYGAAYFPYLTTTYNYKFNDASISVSETVKDPDDAVISGPTSKTMSNLLLGDLEYNAVKAEINRVLKVVLPPSSGMAGIYARVDRDRGVWKAPANVIVNAVSGPVEKITDNDQKTMNIDTTGGKSVNAIRYFTGKGVLVWGARTLAGNDNEWKYISVRRFYNMVEESVKKSSSWVVFEPNDANTWVKVKSMIENYLIKLWRLGALAGPTPEKAFFVKVGLGQTMTSLDILEGRMNIEIGMAVVRPAEFIILRFSHKMQES